LAWAGPDGTRRALTVAGGFFIWGSVFNLFIVSLFWILMSELYSAGEAKRLYGFIAAGGSTGALLGPLIAQTLATVIRPANLLGLAGLLLVVAMLAAMQLRRLHEPNGAGQAPRATVSLRDLIAGAEQVVRSRFLLGIATWVFLANLVDTFFYLEQARIVGEAIPDKAQRVQMFARLDLAVSLLTILIQIFGTGRILERLGVGPAAAALPCVAITGLLAMAVAPVLAVVAAIMVAIRVTAFASASPAVKVLYTSLAPEEKFKAQNFIDTAVYRGGDAAAGVLFGHGAKAAAGSAGGSVASVALMVLPIAFVWLALSFMVEKYRPPAERADAAPH
jgi:AAA family ATP:ADP antiporter